MRTNPNQIFDLNVIAEKILPTPQEIKERHPLSPAAKETVEGGRKAIQAILDRQDPRLLVIVGPCSIHDIVAAKDYAVRLKTVAEKIKERIFIVMRVYFTKPRTSVGWKGFINDPDLDDSFNIEKGLAKARDLLIDINEIGLPVGTEALDAIVPQYIDDLLTWNAIGARTTESQAHREMSSGLSTPVGFKNGTDGNTQVAINAIRSSLLPHHFLGINQQGQCAVIQTRGNPYAHIVLRGGNRPNYDSVNIALVEEDLSKAKLPVNIVVDCSHGNSLKDPALQPLVFDNCINQIVEGNRSIIGLMLESNINFGSQSLPKDLSKLKYGVSITDGCLDWARTEELLLRANEKLRQIK